MMKGIDVVWSKEMKDIAVYCMTSSTAVENIAHYLVEYIAMNDESLEGIECSGECQHEIDIYNEALTKVIQKSKYFKTIRKFLQTVSEYYCYDYYVDFLNHLKEWNLEVTTNGTTN